MGSSPDAVIQDEVHTSSVKTTYTTLADALAGTSANTNAVQLLDIGAFTDPPTFTTFRVAG